MLSLLNEIPRVIEIIRDIFILVHGLWLMAWQVSFLERNIIRKPKVWGRGVWTDFSNLAQKCEDNCVLYACLPKGDLH